METTVATVETTKRRRLPPVDKSFASEAELSKGQSKALELGHTYDTRKFKVTAGGKNFFVLGYSPASAVAEVWEQIGVQVTELDPKARAAMVLTPQVLIEKFVGLSEEDRKFVLASLNKKK